MKRKCIKTRKHAISNCVNVYLIYFVELMQKNKLSGWTFGLQGFDTGQEMGIIVCLSTWEVLICSPWVDRSGTQHRQHRGRVVGHSSPFCWAENKNNTKCKWNLIKNKNKNIVKKNITDVFFFISIFNWVAVLRCNTT